MLAFAQPQTPAFYLREESPYVRSAGSVTTAWSGQLLMPQSKSPWAEFEAGSRTYRVSFDEREAPPDWVKPVFASLASRWATVPGWDGYRALPTNPSLVAALLNCLRSAMPPGAKPPIVTPLYDGGVQAEWHTGCASLEIVVSAEGPPSFNYSTGDGSLDQEGGFDESLDTVRKLIGSF